MTDVILAADDLLNCWYETSEHELEQIPGRLQWLISFLHMMEGADLTELSNLIAGGDWDALAMGIGELQRLVNDAQLAINKANGKLKEDRKFLPNTNFYPTDNTDFLSD